MKRNKLLTSGFSVIFFILFMNITINPQDLIIQSGVTFSLGSTTLFLPGDWNNSGTFNSENETVIFFGFSGNQTITSSSGETFYNLAVNKTSKDLQLNDNITVNNSLTVTNGDIDLNGNTITLASDALLSETPGNTVKGTSGKITIAKDIGTPSQVNVGGLGAEITSSSNLGSTVVERYHSAAVVGTNEGILRRYNIAPANNSNLNADFRFYYDESELNGIGENTLALFKSDDGSDDSWNLASGSTVNAIDNHVELSGISDFSHWTLFGDGAASPGIQILNQTIDFVDVGIGSNAQSNITIKNIGNAPLIVDTITNNSAVFEVSPKNFSVAPGDSQEVAVTFQPTDAVQYNDTINIVHNSQGSPTEILVSGEGIASAIQVSNLTVDFGNVKIGSSAQKTIAVKNIGNAPLIVNTITSSDPVFQLSLNSFTVPPVDSQEIVLTFQPLDAVQYNDTINIVHNAPGSPTEISVSGKGTPVTGISDRSIPEDYGLSQNYPNPFNPSTIINYQLPEGSHVTLKVYDVLGNKVASLVDEYKAAGMYRIQFNAGSLSSGLYFYRIQSGSFAKTRKLILLR